MFIGICGTTYFFIAASLQHGPVLSPELLKAFITMSLRSLTIISVTFTIRVATA